MINRKPLLGFGPLGWIASIALAILLALVLAGVDVQYHYLDLLNRLLGTDIFERYFFQLHVFYGISIRAAGFTLVSLIYTTIALFIYPRRVGIWRYCPLVAWVLLHTTRWWHHLVHDVASLASMPSYLAYAIAEIPSALLLLLCTRSWRICLATLSIIAATYGAAAVLTPLLVPGWSGGMYASWSIARTDLVTVLHTIVWHVALCSVLLVWATHHRLSANRMSLCPHCGYDLRAAQTDPCPECGHPGLAT